MVVVVVVVKPFHASEFSFIVSFLRPHLPSPPASGFSQPRLFPSGARPGRLKDSPGAGDARSRSRSLQDSFVGEVLFPCAEASWDPRAPSGYSWELASTKTKLSKHRSAHGLSCSVLSSPPRAVGQLLLLLQHQAAAGRIKVLLRKAEALGRLSRMPGPPGHYVIVHLHHDGHIIDTKETKSVSGYSPVWNAPFLFSIPAGDIQQQQLALEFVVMQVRLVSAPAAPCWAASGWGQAPPGPGCRTGGTCAAGRRWSPSAGTASSPPLRPGLDPAARAGIARDSGASQGRLRAAERGGGTAPSGRRPGSISIVAVGTSPSQRRQRGLSPSEVAPASGETRGALSAPSTSARRIRAVEETRGTTTQQGSLRPLPPQQSGAARITVMPKSPGDKGAHWNI
ncbi:uncharacterized protein LOC120758812 [Hirundo rustica]|uniref:uncharacterized protein LOC120758812 n=1 Tax=Hirundo rustica TaxID=43150 RepID=UPI002671F55E|nr:uncharacterized protein LOC120758812 [Hirundo rustica]